MKILAPAHPCCRRGEAPAGILTVNPLSGGRAFGVPKRAPLATGADMTLVVHCMRNGLLTSVLGAVCLQNYLV